MAIPVGRASSRAVVQTVSSIPSARQQPLPRDKRRLVYGTFSDVLIDIYALTHHIWCVIKIVKQATDEAILRELGGRLAKARLERNFTQSQLAAQAGVSKNTVQRLESGGVATQLSGFIRVCRVLEVIERFDLLVPEPVPSPIEQLQLRGRKRRRASARRKTKAPSPKWQWRDEP
jgi:transcriptional regulator with XRE-family HTH domain